MKKQPLLNALLALLYVVGLVSLMSSLSRYVPDTGKTIMAPIFFLSIFTLSAGVMAYLFVAQPIQLYADGAKQDGVRFFLKTLGSFAIFTGIILLILLSGIFSGISVPF